MNDDKIKQLFKEHHHTSTKINEWESIEKSIQKESSPLKVLLKLSPIVFASLFVAFLSYNSYQKQFSKVSDEELIAFFIEDEETELYSWTDGF